MNKSLNYFFSFSLFIKLVVALLIPVTLDEYYYYTWGQHLSLSYFDHPPMVGWLMFLAEPFRTIAEGTMRWPFIMLSHGTLFLWYLILKGELNDGRMKAFLMTALLNPLWGLGVFIATPDIPLVFFWSLSLYFTKRLMSSDRLSDYLWLGASLGLGFLSKYQIVLFVPALVIFLWQQKLFRRILSWKTIPTLLLGLLVCSPVFLWNMDHEWASFSFQWKHGMASEHWSWQEPFLYILSQAMLLLPPFLFFLFNKDRKWLKHWLSPFVIFPFVFFLYSSFKGKVEANWVIMAFPSFYALSYLFTKDLHLKWLRYSNILWGSLTLCLLIVLQLQIPLKSKLSEANQFADVLQFSKEADLPVLGYSYQSSGFLSYKTGKLVCKLQTFGRIDHFNFFEACKETAEHFYFITEADYQPILDFPNYGLEKVSTKEIAPKYIVFEVRKQ